jgi:hypothetical protein
MLRGTLFVYFGFAASAAVLAGPISYNESIDGDLPDTDPLKLLTLGLGTNTISGTFGANEILDTVDFDPFAFIVPAGTHVSSGSVLMISTEGGINRSQWFLSTGALLINPAPDFGFAGQALDLGLVINGLTGSASLHALPLGEGTYHITPSSFGSVNPILFPIETAAYVFTFNVDLGTVTTLPPQFNPFAPEPAGWLLTTTGFAGLFWRRCLRRVKRSR